MQPKNCMPVATLSSAVFHVDFSVGVLQVAVTSAGPQIDPTAQIAVSQKPMMLFVGVRFDHRGFDFAADLNGVPQRDAVFQGSVFDHACAGDRRKRDRKESRKVRLERFRPAGSARRLLLTDGIICRS